MVKEKYDVTGMSCAACSARVEKTVRALDGVDDVTVNLLTNSMQVIYNEKSLNKDGIISAVEKAGYGAAVHGDDRTAPVEQKTQDEMKDKKRKLLLSILLLIPEMYISMYQMLYNHFGLPAPDFIKLMFDGPENSMAFAFTQFLLALPIALLNRNYYVNGVKALLSKAPNMDSLVGLGSGAAFIYGIVNIYFIGWHLGHGNSGLIGQYSANLYFDSAAMIVTLVSVGKYLESKAKYSTTSALRKLISYAPKTVTVERRGSEYSIPVNELVAGDIVIARPGAVIAADGVIVEGKTSVNESAITGESIPVDKQPGDGIISGAVNINGYIKYEARQVGADSTLSRLINLVDEAASSKAPIAKLADKISGIFVPVVILIALMTGVVWLGLGYGSEMAFSMAVSVLVISCPCALGLATPVAIMAGIGKGAENGILIKSGEILEIVSKATTVIMDKTGTITEGKPTVTDVIPINISAEELIKKAAVLERSSEHPIAQAIVNGASNQNIDDITVTEFEAVWGEGVKGLIGDEWYYLGNLAFIRKFSVVEENYIRRAETLANDGKTVLYMAGSGSFIGLIGIADTVKENSATAIKKFKALGINTVMLTGDNNKTAAAMAAHLQVDKYYAEVRPEKKADFVKELQSAGETVAMIGDGINDAPALALADAGIAIGAGTDIALESADAILSKNDLLDGVRLLRLSQAVIKNIKENLFWALFYNIICIPVAAGVLYPIWGIKLSPMLGAAAMSCSSVCVVLNALRLKSLNLGQAEKISTEVSEKGAENFMEKELRINGMMCMHCQKNVERALGGIDGVESVTVNLDAGTATVKCKNDIPDDTFDKVITEAGYELVH